jgi:hypothetical protein
VEERERGGATEKVQAVTFFETNWREETKDPVMLNSDIKERNKESERGKVRMTQER